ncbi:MAG TPA: nucleotide-binding protein [Candidatus Nanopelagicales bacterium]|nr:nucleotide-binding protein [Candidatus Nanopelagicales bacterium]
MPDPPGCRVFIGSSTEGGGVAQALRLELLKVCEPVLWSQDVFEPGGYTLDSLIEEAKRCDFAVLVATPDDGRESRGSSTRVPRDNIVLEFGLFAGILGRQRTFLLATGGAQLPSDTLGLTRLAYHDEQTNPRTAVAEAAAQVGGRIEALGRVERLGGSATGATSRGDGALQAELEKLIHNATSQGWTAKNSPTALRLRSPKGKTFTLTKTTPEGVRAQLRPFAAEVRASGLRVSNAVRRPPDESPFA